MVRRKQAKQKKKYITELLAISEAQQPGPRSIMFSQAKNEVHEQTH